jgi:hypothetical protein
VVEFCRDANAIGVPVSSAPYSAAGNRCDGACCDGDGADEVVVPVCDDDFVHVDGEAGRVVEQRCAADAVGKAAGNSARKRRDDTCSDDDRSDKVVVVISDVD